MFKYILKRVIQVIPLLILITFIVFSLMYLAPYDAVDAIATPNMSPEALELIKEKNGLNEPFIVQYFMWVKNILRGNFGNSILSQISISSELSYRIPNTMKLIIPSYTIAIILSVLLGLLAAAKKNKALDKIIDTLCSVGIATPAFWIAMIFIYYFGLRLNKLPITGMHTIGMEGDLGDFIKHLILPVSVLVLAIFPSITRYIRSTAISQLNETYVDVQKSLGASKLEIFIKHIGRNVLLPIITLIGQSLPSLVTGATVTESIFQWPGVGPYLVSASKQLDYPVIMAVLLLTALLTIIGNLLADVLYVVADPRIKLGGE